MHWLKTQLRQKINYMPKQLRDLLFTILFDIMSMREIYREFYVLQRENCDDIFKSAIS